jgi:hypothetical protein
MRRAILVLAVLAAVIGTACAQGAATAPAASGKAGYGAAAPAVPAPDMAQHSDAAGGTSPEQGIPTLGTVGRDLILTASVTMRSRDPWATADQARAIAAGLGGDVLGLSQSGSGDQRNATLTIRVPSDRFDDALAQLKKLEGEVLTSNVDGKDVTDQFVDLQARLTARQAEEQSYLALLTKAQSVDEILKVQSALFNVRAQIEQLQGQLNSMKGRIDYSTITMSISPLVPVAGPSGTWDPSVTFARALAALGALFRVLADIAIWLLVFGWIPLIAAVLLLAALRVRKPAPA